MSEISEMFPSFSPHDRPEIGALITSHFEQFGAELMHAGGRERFPMQSRERREEPQRYCEAEMDKMWRRLPEKSPLRQAAAILASGTHPRLGCLSPLRWLNRVQANRPTTLKSFKRLVFTRRDDDNFSQFRRWLTPRLFLAASERAS